MYYLISAGLAPTGLGLAQACSSLTAAYSVPLRVEDTKTAIPCRFGVMIVLYYHPKMISLGKFTTT
jgi:hypothetical protein